MWESKLLNDHLSTIEREVVVGIEVQSVISNFHLGRFNTRMKWRMSTKCR